jgi:hypothetical protein
MRMMWTGNLEDDKSESGPLETKSRDPSSLRLIDI